MLKVKQKQTQTAIPMPTVILILKQVQHDIMIGTPALKSSNKFGISLAYSYLWRSAESTPVDFVFLLLTRHKMQASSALVSFVGSEILKRVWYFAHLFVPLSA
jgi:hypothetical protein